MSLSSYSFSSDEVAEDEDDRSAMTPTMTPKTMNTTTPPNERECPLLYHRSLERTLSEEIPYQKEFPPTKTLIQQIRRRDWNGARVRILTYPWDAHYKSKRSSSSPGGASGKASTTPLHLVCLYRAPIDVVELLLDANPSALVSQDAEGWTPIHLVLLYGGDEEIALMLIRRGGAPAASLPSPFVGSPLHLACRHGSCTKILELLLCANQSMASAPNETGTKPAAFVWNHFARNPANESIMQELRQTKKWNIPVLDGIHSDDSHSHLSSTSTVVDLLDRMTLLVRAAKQEDSFSENYCYDADKGIISSTLVYDMVSHQSILGDLSQILALIVRCFPKQVEYCDLPTENLPLHQAASTPPVSTRKGVARQYSPRIIDPCKMDPIEILVRSYPSAAACCNKKKDVPLHLALTKGRRTWNSGISALVEAESDVLLLQDTVTGLYPFQLAAAFPVPDEIEALGTVLELLLACPHALKQ